MNVAPKRQPCVKALGVTVTMAVMAVMVVGCATSNGVRHGRHGVARVTNSDRTGGGAVGATVGVVPPVAVAELEALVRRAAEPGGEATVAQWGVVLGRAGGARTLTGEPERDDRVSTVTLVARVGLSAAVVVQTVCGSAVIVGLFWQDGSWMARGRVGLVDGVRPGRCRETSVRAEARAIETDQPREILAVTRSVSDEGDEVDGPWLRVFYLERDGALTARSGALAIGDEDPATGAVRQGDWIVEEALSTPRDFYIELLPGRRGPGGAEPRREIVRTTYRLRDGSYVPVAEERSEFRERANGAGRADGVRLAVPLDGEE